MWWLPLALALDVEPNRTWDVFDAPETDAQVRTALGIASWAFVDRGGIELAGVHVDAARLATWSASTGPLQAFIREDTKRPVDLSDLLWFLDDVLHQDRRDTLVVTMGRARSRGIMVHPDDVFGGASIDYGRRSVRTDRPAPQRWVPPAEDGEPLGVRWTTRFPNPPSQGARLDALTAERPGSDFAERIALLGAQLEAQGAAVYVTSTARDPRRGLLLWGSFLLSRAATEREVSRIVDRLEAAERDWDRPVDIVWMHPDGWEATIRHATEMAETYDVVYATEQGARYSNHYGGRSVDMVAFGLPRSLTLVAPDGASRTFDLSDPGEPLDLSLQPVVIDWVEAHFGLEKLRSDHPHWTDISP